MSCQFTIEQHIIDHAILGVLPGGGGGGAAVGESTTVSPPLVLDGYNISIPPATDVADGYLTSADHLLLTKIQGTAPVSTFAGQQWYDTTDNQQYIFDGYRSKFLAQAPIQEGSARRFTGVSDIYLWTFNGTPTNEAPLVLPFDCTLIGMTASCTAAATWDAQVHLSLTLVPGAVLSVVAATSAFNYNFDVDFTAGDAVQTFMSGTSIDMPRVNLFFVRRGS